MPSPVVLIPRHNLQRVPPGRGVARGSFMVGDFILTHGTHWNNRLIRWGQGFRIHGDDRVYAHWDHVAVIVSEAGDLVEAWAPSVRMAHLDDYIDQDYALVRLYTTTSDRRQIARYALSQVGTRYGWLAGLSVTLRALTGAKVSFNAEGEHICSGLVARALERGDFIPDRSPEHITPADLAFYFGVKP